MIEMLQKTAHNITAKILLQLPIHQEILMVPFSTIHHQILIHQHILAEVVQ